MLLISNSEQPPRTHEHTPFLSWTQNSNVVEFYSRVVKDDNQLTYYDSGIGTYVKPSQRFGRMWQRLYNMVDMAIAL